MIQKKIEIAGQIGIDGRCAALIAQTAGRYSSDVWIVKDDKRVSGKSVMGLMSLRAVSGSVITIGAEGEDEIAALKDLMELSELGFKELQTNK